MALNDYLSDFLKLLSKKNAPDNPSGIDDITQWDINEIKNSGQFTPEERAQEYRRRGKSPSGVINGIYDDFQRGNDEYNDAYRDWDADA